MGIFGSILNKLGLGHADAAPAVDATTDAAAPEVQATADAAPVPAAMSEVDVESKLDAMDGSDDLNWRTSIVDLLTLLKLDSSFSERKTLAGEVGVTDYEGSAEQNETLHKAVLQKIADNGGSLPASLLG